MKKLFSIISVLLLVNTISAQVIKPYKVSDFTGIDASTVYKIEVDKTTNESLTIETTFELMKYIEVKVNKGVLYLSLNTNSMPRSLKRNTPEIKAKIGIKNLEKVILSGASTLISRSAFSSSKFIVSLSGATFADISAIDAVETKINITGASKLIFKGKGKDANLEVSGASKLYATMYFAQLSAEASGASYCEIAGTSTKAQIEVSGASIFKAEAYTCSSLIVDASGASRAIFGKLKEVTIDASGAATIKYYGNPIVIKKDVSGASTVKQLD